MKINKKGFLAGTLLAAGLALSYSASAQIAQVAAQPGVTPQMTAAWWQWAVSIPTSVHPLRYYPDTDVGAVDPSSVDCMVGQHGDVWFLGGKFKQVDVSPPGDAQTARQTANTTEPDIIRECEVPLGMPILMPVFNAGCNAAEEIYLNNIPDEWDYRTRVGFLRDDCLKVLTDAIVKSTLEAKFGLAGQEMPLNIQRVRTAQPFSITYARDQILPDGWEPNPTLALADGYWVLVRPLRAGEYVLETFGEAPAFEFSVRIRYLLKVIAPEDQVGLQ